MITFRRFENAKSIAAIRSLFLRENKPEDAEEIKSVFKKVEFKLEETRAMCGVEISKIGRAFGHQGYGSCRIDSAGAGIPSLHGLCV
jgi:hypothetical protein